MDLGIAGRGLDLGITRVFGTPYAFRTGSPYVYDNYTLTNLGYGWSLDFPWLGTNYFHLSSGQAYPYQWNGNSFEYHRAVDFKLVNTGSGYTLYTKSGTVYQFDANKRLTSITDRTGDNIIAFSYGTNSYISQITDTIGRVVTFSYNTNNQLASIAYASRTWTYGYSGNNLVSMTDPDGRVTTYQYSSGAPAGIVSWLISAVLYPTGGKTTYAYGSAPVNSQVSTYYVTSKDIYYSSTSLSQSSSISYNLLNGNPVWSNATVSDGTNIQAYQDYNFQSPNSLMKLYVKSSSGSLNRITEYDYDSSGRISQTKLSSPTNALLASSQTNYDNWGNLIYSKDNVGKETWYSYANTNSQNTFGTTGFTNNFYSPNPVIGKNVYDALVGEASFQNGPGATPMESYLQYDSSGNLLSQRRLYSGSWLYTNSTYDAYGNRVSATDSLGRTAYYHYSSTYQHAYLTMTSVLVGAQNVTASSTYDSAEGWLLSQTDANGQTTSYAYDTLGRPTQVTYPAVGGVQASKYYAYDDTNNILTTTDEDGNVAKGYFDGLGRMISVARYSGSSAYSTESYTYNWLNLVATKTTPTGSVYAYTYDQDGRLTKTLNPDNSYSTISYDDVNAIKTVTDENGHQTTYGYDWAGKLLWVKQYYGSTSYYQTSYGYDLTGNLLTVTDANDQATSYQYDDLNRLVKTTFPDNTYATKTYDSVGNLASSTDPAGKTTTYSYDSLNRLTAITYPGGSTVSYAYDKAGNRLSDVEQAGSFYYTYDARNRLTNETDVLGGAKYPTLYSYDKAGNVLSVTYPDGYALSYSYDAMNRVTSAGSFASFTYNADDSMKTISFGNGVVSAYSYDSRARPTRILATSGTTHLLDLNYTYDSAGNVLGIGSETYSYDWLNRLTASTGPWGSTSYTYDPAGNAASRTKNSVTTTYTYGSYNRLTSAGNATFTYNANGDTTKIVNGSTTWQYGYDSADRLANATKNSQLVQANAYSSSGNRVKQTIGSSIMVYAYRGLQIIFEKNLTSGAITDRFYANGLQLAKVYNGTTYYLISDALGSTRLVTTANAVTFFSSNYQPYGIGYSMSGVEEFMYTGKMMDAITGLYYFGARFYDDAVGRFITEDSYSGRRENPLSLNRYIYANDNPMRFIDVGGHATVESDCEDESTCYYGGWATPVAHYAPPSPASLVNPTVVINVAPPTPPTPPPTDGEPPAPPSRCEMSPDACLTQSGGNQQTTTTTTTSTTTAYATTITSTSTTTATTTTSYTTTTGVDTLPEPQTAETVVYAFGIFTTTMGLSTVATLVAPPPIDLAAVFVLGSLTMYGAAATLSAQDYVNERGNNATPLGAFVAGIVGAILQWLP